jgi:hypothetical protein
MMDLYMRPMKLGISYVRWSTPEQRLGDSGLSASSGKHRKEGSTLSRFLKEVEEGM